MRGADVRKTLVLPVCTRQPTGQPSPAALLRTMESLIPILDKLQVVSKAVGEDGFHLPRIVFVGSQGSGKSSVLENVVGRSFLPKGTGAVTRTPLVLNLVHSPREPGPHRREGDGTLTAEEYGVFSDANDVFTDFDKICSEIRRRTDNLAGKNKRISEKEITLNLYSPRLPNLTLVDLPGLTKVPVGDQPYKVETQISDLVLKYIEYTDAIIMAVVPANTDMATNDSLKLAKDCDPEGDRTVAVLTKVDLMDAGTDATDVLEGKVIHVKKGIVAVVNRSQKDADDKKAIAHSLMKEAEFLSQKYPSLAGKNGTSFLVATLKKLLLEHIRDYLVEVTGRVELKLEQTEALLGFYYDDYEGRKRGWVKIINEFSSAYCEEIRASASKFKRNARERGTGIFQIIHETFQTELDKFNISTSSIINHKLISDFIERFKEPSLSCARRVCEEMKELLKKCLSDRELLLNKFTDLQQKVQTLVEKLLDSQHRIVECVIGDLVFYDIWSKSQGTLQEARRGVPAVITDEERCSAARKIVHVDVTATVTGHLVTEVRKYLQSRFVEDVSTLAGVRFRSYPYDAMTQSQREETLEALREARDSLGQIDVSTGDCGQPRNSTASV